LLLADALLAGPDVAIPPSRLGRASDEGSRPAIGGDRLPAWLTAIGWVALFAQPFLSLVSDWWNLSEAGHGLLLAPLAVWLAWRSGIDPRARPNRAAGCAILIVAVILRYLSSLAAESFITREAMVVALGGLTIYYHGTRQIVRWWLPFVLAILAVPLPEIITQTLALPLQFDASRLGAWLLNSRHVPVQLSGNIIGLPGRQLFVTEACSGLRSLTALISLAVLLGGVGLVRPASRIVLLGLAVPIAIVLNGLRVFVTGFLVYFLSPSYGEGFLHATEGWLFFIVSFCALALAKGMIAVAERYIPRRAHAHV